MYKAAYFFCINPNKDHVAPEVMDICNEMNKIPHYMKYILYWV